MLDDPREPRQQLSWAETKSRADSAPISLPLVQPGIPACELRWERPIKGDGTGTVEIVCMAAGAKRLAVKGGDVTDMLVTCGACTIPTETARRPCLFLVPIKLERDRKVRDYFICRWFYSLKPEKPATSTDWMCGSCPYWFPRPPLNLLQDYEDATYRMIRYHQDAWAGRLPHKPLVIWSGPWTPPLPWWKRFLKPLVRLWSALWGLPEPY